MRPYRQVVVFKMWENIVRIPYPPKQGLKHVNLKPKTIRIPYPPKQGLKRFSMLSVFTTLIKL